MTKWTRTCCIPCSNVSAKPWYPKENKYGKTENWREGRQTRRGRDRRNYTAVISLGFLLTSLSWTGCWTKPVTSLPIDHRQENKMPTKNSFHSSQRPEKGAALCKTEHFLYIKHQLQQNIMKYPPSCPSPRATLKPIPPSPCQTVPRHVPSLSLRPEAQVLLDMRGHPAQMRPLSFTRPSGGQLRSSRAQKSILEGWAQQSIYFPPGCVQRRLDEKSDLPPQPVGLNFREKWLKPEHFLVFSLVILKIPQNVQDNFKILHYTRSRDISTETVTQWSRQEPWDDAEVWVNVTRFLK